ncbi:hypothetical protein KR009_005260 [Drosophila setifemur]|nr:hypothetical protein KR009_005260 [Drosophila setifemur]
MAFALDTPVISIYDLMMERQRNLIRDAQLKGVNMGMVKGLRKIIEEKLGSGDEGKLAPTLAPVKTKPKTKTEFKRWSPASHSPSSETRLPANAIKASHLTKKQLFTKHAAPAKKEVISKLVEKMSKGPSRAKAESPVPTRKSSPRKALPSCRRKKGSKSNRSMGKRLPLSPKKAGAISKEHIVTPKPAKFRTPRGGQKPARTLARKTKPKTKSPTSPYGRWRI